MARALGIRRVFVSGEEEDEQRETAERLRKLRLFPFFQNWDRRAFASVAAPPESRPCGGRTKGRGATEGGKERPGKGGAGDVLLRVERALATGQLDAEGGLVAMIADAQIVSEAEGIVGGAGKTLQVACCAHVTRVGRRVRRCQMEVLGSATLGPSYGCHSATCYPPLPRTIVVAITRWFPLTAHNT